MRQAPPPARELIEIRPNAVYTLAEAAAILRVSDATIRRYLKSGALPSHRMGRAYRFLGVTLLAALAVPSVRVQANLRGEVRR